MTQPDPYLTRETLIKRVANPHDHHSWEEFIQQYRGYIYTIVRNMNIAETDRDEVIQQTLIKLWKKLPELDRSKDGRFRSWLSTVTKHCVIDFIRKQNQETKLLYKVSHDQESTQAGNDDLSMIETVEESAWKHHITNMALQNIQSSFSGKAIDAFKLSLTGMETPAIAKKLGIQEASVYRLKTRVKALLIEEVQRLRETYE